MGDDMKRLHDLCVAWNEAHVPKAPPPAASPPPLAPTGREDRPKLVAAVCRRCGASSEVPADAWKGGTVRVCNVGAGEGKIACRGEIVRAASPHRCDGSCGPYGGALAAPPPLAPPGREEPFEITGNCKCGAFLLLTVTGIRYEENAGAICRHTQRACEWFAPGASPTPGSVPAAEILRLTEDWERSIGYGQGGTEQHRSAIQGCATALRALVERSRGGR